MVFLFVSFVSFVSFVMSPPQAAAQMTGAPAAGYKREPGMTASTIPAPLREIGFDQNLDQLVPLDTPLVDEAGRAVRLGDFFGKRPVVLVFAYYDCPMLCTQVINGLSSALGVLSLEPGKDFEIVTVSFDPRDTPATATAKKAVYLDRYKRPGAAAAWHFLTGDPASIAQVDQGGRVPLRLGRPDEAVRASDRRDRPDIRRAGSRDISSASNTGRAIFVWPWSKRPRARSARPSMRCCSTAITTIR